MPQVSKAPLKADTLEAKLGIRLHNRKLLHRALSHRSTSGEHMERLEFLGDAVLGLVIAEYLHNTFPEADEGQLSRFRAALVRKESLYQVAQDWSLSDYLNVGEGEREHGRIKSPSIVANAVEAVIGAVFTDMGWLAAQKLVIHAWQPLLQGVGSMDVRDAKSQLQEYTQGKGWGLPTYKVEDLGVGHTPRFETQCWVQDKFYAYGRGKRKKDAELQAAQRTLIMLQDNRGDEV